MAKGRRQDAWDRAAALMAVVANLFAKEAVSPQRLHPYRPPPPKTPAQVEQANRDGWRLLETGLKEIARGNH
jgi:hypothetical protein